MSSRRQVYRGRVLPLDGLNSRDEHGFVVQDGRIVAVGTDDVRPDDEVIDFGDRVIIPGFCDPHTHTEVASVAMATMADCMAPGVTSIEDIQEVLRRDMAKAELTGWLVAQGNLFLDQKLKDKRLPTREDLDVVSTDVPIAIRAGGHTTALNSKALELIGYEFEDPTESVMGPATVERDASGRATGLVSELDNLLPIPPIRPDELRKIVTRGFKDLLLAHGVTSVGEITETREGVEAIADAVSTGDIDTRVLLYVWAPGTLPLQDALSWQDHLRIEGDPGRVRVDGIKIFLDGGFSGRTAAMLTPYEEPYALTPGSCGDMAMETDEIRRQVAAILDAGLNPVVHTCGERAQLILADVLRDLRPEGLVRAEHAPNYVSEPSTIDRWIEEGIAPVTNPGFIQSIGLSLPEYLGDVGRTGRFPYRTVLDRGIRLAGASDMHMGGDPRQTNPFFGIWCAVGRKGFTGELVEPAESVTVTEALLMHTLYAAEVMQIDDTRGSISVGKFADFVVLDRDPREVPVDELLDVHVDEVYVGGSRVHVGTARA
jgi:predicted amidohydrolase YtcJ